MRTSQPVMFPEVNDKTEKTQGISLHNKNSIAWYLNTMPQCELEKVILKAAEKACKTQSGKPRYFSTNDLFLSIEINGCSFQAVKGTVWEKRFSIINLGIIQSTLRKNGYATIKMARGSCVRKWFNVSDMETQSQHAAESIRTDEEQKDFPEFDYQRALLTHQPISNIMEVS